MITDEALVCPDVPGVEQCCSSITAFRSSRERRPFTPVGDSGRSPALTTSHDAMTAERLAAAAAASLRSAVSDRRVRALRWPRGGDGDGARRDAPTICAAWMDACLDETLGAARRAGGAARAWRPRQRRRLDGAGALDDEVHALRPSSAGAAASRAMGARLLKTWQRDPTADGSSRAGARAGTRASTLAGRVRRRVRVVGHRPRATARRGVRLHAAGGDRVGGDAADADRPDATRTRCWPRTLERVPAIVDAIARAATRPHRHRSRRRSISRR